MVLNHSEHLATHAAITPDSCALRFEGRSYSFAELDCWAGQLASWLSRRGVGFGDRIGLLLPNCLAFIVAHQATLRLGAIAVAFNPKSRARAVAHMLADCTPKVLFVTPDSAASLPDPELGPGPAPLRVAVDGEVPGAVSWELALRGRKREPVEVEPQTPAVILYSSGTTGPAKGVVLSHANLEFNARAKLRYLGIGSDDRLLLFVPLSHVFGQNAIMSPALMAGATIVLYRRFDPEQIAAALGDEAVSMVFAVPTVYRMLLDSLAGAAPPTVRLWFSAAATLPEDLSRRWQRELGAAIFEGYGLTETSPFACFNHLREHRIGSVGAAIDGVELRVVDPDTGAELGPGAPGEIQVRGPNVMLGYWGRKAETAAAVVDGWFRTGDLGTIDVDGYVVLIDRIKDMIDVAGLKVWPSEVEAVLEDHAEVARAAVYRRPDRDTGERVAASVIVEPGAELDAAALARWCRAQLAPYKVPVEFALVDELPISPTGKVLRRVLSQAGAEASASSARSSSASSARSSSFPSSSG